MRADNIIKKDETKTPKKRGIPNSGTNVFKKQPITNKPINKEKEKINKKDLDGFSESVDELINVLKNESKNNSKKSKTQQKDDKGSISKPSVTQINEDLNLKKSKVTKTSQAKKSDSLRTKNSKSTSSKKNGSSKKSVKLNESSKVNNKKSSSKKTQIRKKIDRVNTNVNRLKTTTSRNIRNNKANWKKNSLKFNKIIFSLSIIISTLILLIIIFSKYKIFASDNKVISNIAYSSDSSDIINSDSSLDYSNTLITPAISDSDNSKYELIIESGMSANEIADLISLSNYVDKQGMLNYFIENNLTSKINVGTYYIFPSMSYEEIADLICISDNFTLTIYPGLSINQIDTLLVKRNLIKKGEFVKASTKVANTYGLSFVEGWFLSGKYEITRDLDIEQFALAMFKNTLNTISPFLSDIAKSNYSVEDILIIASLIQAETNKIEQMGLISQVIHNRLILDMPLGINATTSYEIGNYSPDIELEIYNKITPFNTRRKKGLVPTPICSLSYESIYAAIYPIKGDYLYYNHDKDGNIHMAKTYEQHLLNVEGKFENGI